MPVNIKHITTHFPERKYSNEDLLNDFPELIGSDSVTKIGIETRYVVSDEIASDLALKAAERLFDETDVPKGEVDFIIFCAQEFDHQTPTTACLLHEKLGLKPSAGAIDYNLGCSGFVYGLAMAKGFIETLNINNVLLLTASTITKMVHSKDKNSKMIFGDGAAATLISRCESGGIHGFEIGTDGAYGDKIIIKDGMGRSPLNANSHIEMIDGFGNITSNATVHMDGVAIFSKGLKTVPFVIENLLKKHGNKLEDIDLFVFHQANEFMIDSIRKKVGIPKEKFFVCMKQTGNTVASTIPIALKGALDSGKLKKDMKVMLVAFGTGFSWASTIIDWSN